MPQGVWGKKDKLKGKQWFKICFEFINAFFKSVILKCDFTIKKFWPKRVVSSDETWEPSNTENPLKWLTNYMHQTKSG